MADNPHKFYSARDLLTQMSDDPAWKCAANPDLCLVGQNPKVPRAEAPPRAVDVPTPQPPPREAPLPAAQAPARDFSATRDKPNQPARTVPQDGSVGTPQEHLAGIPDLALKPGEIPPKTMDPVARGGKNWTSRHVHNVETAAKGGVDTVFYGDSITEALNITGDMKKTFGKGSQNLGIPGDSTQHLLWRLQNGEADFTGKQPEKGVILIGTNNIGFASDHDTARGIIADVDEASRRLPNTKFLVLGVLPRGELASDPMRAHVTAINAEVQQALAQRNAQGNHHATFADVGKSLLRRDGSMDRALWQGDYWHPTYHDGFSTLLRAIKPKLDAL